MVNLVHIPLLMMLGLGWWTHHPLGIVGAGISSLLSETIAACYAIAYIARRPAYRIFDEVSLSWPLARRWPVWAFPKRSFSSA